MNLQTKIPLEKQSDNQIDYNSKLLLLGSCFVENIGDKLEYYKFQNLQNPFGILFNPVVIKRLVTNAINEKVFTENDVLFHNERWHCYDAHSEMSSTSKEELINNLNASIKLINKQIHKSTHIVITLGTAWVYTHIQTDKIVANCHKVPQKQFKKELLSIETITRNIESITSSIHEVNPNASVIFTVSPVRHVKDGFVQNQRSKAHLISAIHLIMSLRALRLRSVQAPSRSLSYFPSYEIMMDELRDYRFYSEDMIHPSKTAINYIWEKFKMVWITNDAYSTMDEIATIQKGLQHKPFNTSSNEYESFKQELISKQAEINRMFPHILF